MYQAFKKPHTAAGAVLLCMPFVAAAQSNKPLQLAQFILTTSNVVVTIVFVFAVIVFGWGVVKLIIAAGNPTQVQQAKQFIWWGVIGMAILASITGIIWYLQAYTGVPGGAAPINPPTVEY